MRDGRAARGDVAGDEAEALSLAPFQGEGAQLAIEHAEDVLLEETADANDDDSSGSVDPAMRSLIDGGGAHAIREAVRASREAWGCGEGGEDGDEGGGGARVVVRCQVDKKAFPAARRDAICRLLEADGVAYRVK